jgi:hypothetical protein
MRLLNVRSSSRTTTLAEDPGKGLDKAGALAETLADTAGAGFDVVFSDLGCDCADAGAAAHVTTAQRINLIRVMRLLRLPALFAELSTCSEDQFGNWASM